MVAIRSGFALFKVLQPQFKLIDLGIQFLGGAAKLRALQHLELQPQMLNLVVVALASAASRSASIWRNIAISSGELEPNRIDDSGYYRRSYA